MSRCDFRSPIAALVNAGLDQYLTDLTSGSDFLTAAREALQTDDGSTPHEATRVALEARFEALQAQESRLRRLYLAGRIGDAEHDAEQDAIRRDRDAIRRELEALGSPSPRPTEADLVALVKTWGWSSEWTPEVKRDWLARYVPEIRVSNEAIEGVTIRIPCGGGEGQPVYLGGVRQPWTIYMKARKRTP